VKMLLITCRILLCVVFFFSEIGRLVGLWCLTPLSTLNISVISWRSVLLVEETGVPRENLQKVTDKLYHIMFYQVHLAITGFRTHNVSGNGHLLLFMFMLSLIFVKVCGLFLRKQIRGRFFFIGCLYLHCHWQSTYQEE
jgi:hypothetical protein